MKMENNEELSRIAQRFISLIVDEKLYKQKQLSLDDLTWRLSVKGYKLSAAINICLGKNFYTFVNELRLQEAKRLMVHYAGERASINRIAKEAGFNDRKSFFRVCKNVTGLTPTELRHKQVHGLIDENKTNNYL